MDATVEVLQANMKIVIEFMLKPLKDGRDRSISHYEYFVPIKCYLLDMIE